MAERKRTYRKGMTFIHKETKEKVLFGKWADADKQRASCISASKMLLTLDRSDLDENYFSPTEQEKKAREQRKGQWW